MTDKGTILVLLDLIEIRDKMQVRLAAAEAERDRNLAERNKSEQARQDLVVELARIANIFGVKGPLPETARAWVLRAEAAEARAESLEADQRRLQKLLGNAYSRVIEEALELYLENKEHPAYEELGNLLKRVAAALAPLRMEKRSEKVRCHY